MADAKLDWARVDLDSLPAKLQASAREVLAAQARAAELREELRKALEKRFHETKRLEPEQGLALSFKWGGLSLAKVKREAPKPAKNSLKW